MYRIQMADPYLWRHPDTNYLLCGLARKKAVPAENRSEQRTSESATAYSITGSVIIGAGKNQAHIRWRKGQAL